MYQNNCLPTFFVDTLYIKYKVLFDLHCTALLLTLGIFCESSMLTLHNTELELIPQSVYKLPPNVDRVIVNGSRLRIQN